MRSAKEERGGGGGGVGRDKGDEAASKYLAIIDTGVDAGLLLVDQLGVDSGRGVQRHALVRQQDEALIQRLLERRLHEGLGGRSERPRAPLRVHPVLHLVPKEGAAHVVPHMHGRVVHVHREQVLAVDDIGRFVVRAELGDLGKRQACALL